MATYYNEKTYYGSYDGPSCTFRTVMQLRTVRNTSNCTVHVRRYVQTTGGSFKGTTIKTDWGESDTLYSNGTYADSGWVTLGTYSYGTTISVSGKSYYTGGSGTTYSSTASASYLPSKPTYTVSYDANTTDTVSNLPSNQTKTYGTALTISTAVPTREGYNFLNWNTSADGSGTSYASGASYTGNAALKLYAQWELAYHAPIVSGVTVGRCDADGNADDYGTYALVTFSWETDADYGATVSSATVTLDGGSPVSATLTGTTEGTGSAKVGGSLDSETSYKVTVSVVDSAGGRGTASGVVPAVMFPIDFLKTGRGVSILMPSSDEGFHVGADAVFHGTLAVEGGLTGSAARPTYNGANLALASDVTGSTAAYLPITGGTLSGDVTMANEKYYKFATGAGVRGNTSGALVVSSEGDAGVFLRPNGSTSSTGVSVKTSAVHPEVANAVNLGHLTYKWANVYLSGSLSDGTNSVKVADISTSSHTHSLIYSPYKGSRQASADLAVTGDDSIKKFIATSTMTTNKPTLGDAHILHFEWDNTGGWSSQLALNNTTGQIEVRGMSSNTWNAWRQVLDSANFTNYVTPSSIGAVGYTTNAGIAVAGTTKPTYTYVPPSSDGSTGASSGAAYFPEGIIMGGTAAAAGLVTRGVCGVATPDATTGACTKENLFVNYDGTNDYNSGRQLVIQAGSVGTHYGNNLYQYAAARGDAVKAWVEAQGYLPKSGGTMTGALNLANATWNLAGDDAYYGDNNTAGSFAIKGANGTTNLKMVTYNGTTYGTLSWDGSKFVFSSPSDTSGSETSSVKLLTSNGGSVTFGKEGPNSGTMIRLDQVDGTARLRFRASDTAGAMVWEQPEQGAQLYVDLGATGVDKRRITFPSSAGTLALTSQLSSYLPLAGGTVTGALNVSTTSGNGIVTGGSAYSTWSGVQATRLCTNDSSNVNTAGFIINSDGTSKFLHRRGDATASEDAYFLFDGLGYSMYASGMKGTAPGTTPTFAALQNSTRPTFKGSEIALLSDVQAATGVDMSAYAKLSIGNTFDGEQKFLNSSYCPTVTDTASGVGCAFKASRGLFNEALVDKLIMTATTGKIPFYSYSGTSGGAMSSLTEVASIDSDGSLTANGGAYISGRYYGSGDDEGLVIGRASNSYAGLCLGSASGVRSVMYLMPDNSAVWRYNDGSSTYDIKHPGKAGTIALTSDLSSYLPLTGGTMSGNIIVNNSNPHLGLKDTSGSTAYFQTYDDGSGLKAGFGYGWANSMKMDSSGAMYSPGSAYIGSGSGSVVEIGNSTDATTRIYGQQASITTGATNGLWINGRQYGANLTLWSGGYYMTASQSCTLSKSISNQPNGVVLIWSYYSSSASQNYNFITHFIPKAFVSLHGSCGMNFDGGNQTGNVRMNKYLYINDTSITGHASNGTDNAGDEFNVQNTCWVLRYVIGV